MSLDPREQRRFVELFGQVRWFATLPVLARELLAAGCSWRTNGRMGRIALVALLVLVTACAHRHYSGDGRFKDNGWLNYSSRYYLDLGSIDLAQTGTRTFLLKNLPRAEFSVSVNVVESERTSVSGSEPSHVVVVRLELQSSDGKTVVFEEAPLHEWVRSSSSSAPLEVQLYRRGEGIEVSLPNGGTAGRRIGVKHSGGWGSYFDSEPRTEYFLRVSVVASSLSETFPARLTLVGWDR